MRRIIWVEVGSYLHPTEIQHFVKIGPVTFKVAYRKQVPWTSLQVDTDRAQLSKIELQCNIN